MPSEWSIKSSPATFSTMHISVVPYSGSRTKLLEAFWLPGICHPSLQVLFCPGRSFHLFCTLGAALAQHSLRQAELGVQGWGQPCAQSGYLKDSQEKSLNVTNRLFSFTVCSTLQYAVTHSKLNGYLEMHLSPAMTIYYKYGLNKKEE